MEQHPIKINKVQIRNLQIEDYVQLSQSFTRVYSDGSDVFWTREQIQKLIKNLEKSYNKRYQASLIENSRFVQGHGLEHFMEQQKIKYTCPKCGGIISIHDKECSECQEKMK